MIDKPTVPELLPCWCRPETEWLRVEQHIDHGTFGCTNRGYYVYCPNCRTCGPCRSTEQGAKEWWNVSRAPTAPRDATEGSVNWATAERVTSAVRAYFQKPRVREGHDPLLTVIAAEMTTPPQWTASADALLAELASRDQRISELTQERARMQAQHSNDTEALQREVESLRATNAEQAKRIEELEVRNSELKSEISQRLSEYEDVESRLIKRTAELAAARQANEEVTVKPS